MQSSCTLTILTSNQDRNHKVCFSAVGLAIFSVASVFRTRGEGRCGCEVGVLQFAKQRLTAHEQLQDPAVEGD